MKPKVAVLHLIFIYFNLICIVSSFFDLDELKSINYGIDIRNEPVVMKTEVDPIDLNTIQLTSKYGQIYQCNFPNTAEQEKEKEEAEKVAVETGIPDLLKPMETGPCLKLNNGWWTYEFCYGRFISQYHLNEEGKVEGELLSLGLYESEFDWEDNSGQTDLEKKQTRLRRYHTQQYVNGTDCDLNGNQRNTEVRFMCEEGNGDYINRVDEPETCSYIMTVHTTKICHHPFLKPPTPTKTVSITCHPLLTVIQYQEYLDEIEAKDIQKRQEEERQRLKEEELQRLAREKSKYFKQEQDGEEVDDLNDDGTLKSKLSDDLLKDMINVASNNLKEGDTVDVKNVYKVINDASDMDDFIQKAMKEIEKADTTTKAKRAVRADKGKDDEEETLDEEILREEVKLDEDETSIGFDTDNMQKFGDYTNEEDLTSASDHDENLKPSNDDDEEDLMKTELQQAVDAIKKAQKGQVDAITKLSRLQRDNIRRAHSKHDAEDEELDEDIDEGLLEDDGDPEIQQGDDTQAPEEKQRLYKDVKKHVKTLTDKQIRHGDNKQEDDVNDALVDEDDLSDLMQKVDKQLQSMINAQNVMAKLSDDLNDLLEEDKEADKDIKTIKSKYQDKRGRLVDIKQRLRKLMEKEYESILKEAEEELGIEHASDRAAANHELAQTLDGLLDKLDKTEQEIRDVDKELEQFAEFDGEEKVKSVPPVRDDLEPVKGPDMENSPDDRVQVRVSRIKPGQKIPSSIGQDKNTAALEKSVQEELAKAGFANGDKIQVKIITSYYDGDDDSVHTLSEKDSETFKSLIVNLIGGTHEGDKEADRLLEQEENYRFVYGKPKQGIEHFTDNTDSQTDMQTDTQAVIQEEEDGS